MIRIVVPVRGTENIMEVESCEDEFIRFVKELPKLSDNSMLIKFLDEGENKVDLQSIKFRFIKGEENPRILTIKKEKPTFFTNGIEVYLIIDVALYKESYEFYESYSSYTFFANKYLRRLALLLNLIYATPITFLRGVVKIKKKYVNDSGYLMSSVDISYEHAIKRGWPHITGLNFISTLEWMTKFDIKFFSSSNNPAGRAINAFSHLFNYDLFETDSSHLFWCMLGIETLFADGIQSIVYQIKQKTKIILGEPKEFKKKLTELYEFRSRLIHGDLNFPAKFSDDYEGYEEGYWDHVSFSTSLLLASIKLLVLNGVDRFEFEYRWINQKM